MEIVGATLGDHVHGGAREVAVLGWGADANYLNLGNRIDARVDPGIAPVRLGDIDPVQLVSAGGRSSPVAALNIPTGAIRSPIGNARREILHLDEFPLDRNVRYDFLAVRRGNLRLLDLDHWRL